jgi:hypothetical protein
MRPVCDLFCAIRLARNLPFVQLLGMNSGHHDDGTVKKRNLLALTAIYWCAAIMLVGLAVVTAGDCGIAIDAADRDGCFRVAEARRFYGLVGAVLGYPFALWWYVRKCRDGGE